MRFPEGGLKRMARVVVFNSFLTTLRYLFPRGRFFVEFEYFTNTSQK